MNECLKGNHSLIEILRSSLSYDDDHVAMWCTNCGCIVVDYEVDGRRISSKLKIKAPNIYYKWHFENCKELHKNE